MSSTPTPPRLESAYQSVGPLKMYHEATGKGRPLLLLHAGFSTIETSFAASRPVLAQRWTTLAVEQQAHGRTADIDRPLRYEQMVEDTAALLGALDIADADVFGWSDGGVVALGLAARHPERVRKVAVIGAGYNTGAQKPDFQQRMATMDAGNPHLAEFRQAYEAVAPEPARWPVLIDKIKAMYAGFAGWSEAEMKALKAPLMVMLGDDDFVRPEHALELFRMGPNRRLAVLPGSDHSAPVKHADWVSAMLVDFFDAPMPKPVKG